MSYRLRTGPPPARRCWFAKRKCFAPVTRRSPPERPQDAVWQAVETAYEFEGPDGNQSLVDLFAGRRQLIVYRAFFEPGVYGWPDHACIACSMVADQVADVGAP